SPISAGRKSDKRARCLLTAIDPLAYSSRWNRWGLRTPAVPLFHLLFPTRRLRPRIPIVRGLMQHDDLVLTRILDRAQSLHRRGRIVTKTAEGTHRASYEEFGERVGRLASALADLGVRPGDRVGSFAWNTWRHLELYFAVPCMGAVLHTLNIRLHPEQIAWIATHAEDRVVFVDASLLPVWEKVAPHLKTVEK